MQEMKSLDYKENYEHLVPQDAFRISPSMIYHFSDKKWEWYRTQVLGEQGSFIGSDSTVLGTCIHRVAERYIKTGKIDLDELYNYVDNYKEIELENPEFIKSQIEPMGQALINYLDFFGIPERSEEAIAAEILPNIYAGGTADALIGDTLIDFKTTSLTTPKEYIPNNYKWQLLTYAWIYRKMGVNVNKIRIVWITNNIVGRISEKTGKPLKDYPSQVVPVTEVITEDDMRFIEDYLRLIAETYLKGKECPELVYLLYSDYRLKDINQTYNPFEKDSL